MMLRRSRKASRLALGLLGVLLLAVSAVPLEIAVYSTRSAGGPADAAIVLGAAVITDRPSPVFEERIRHAVELYRAGMVRKLVMTGGLGPGDRVTEAEAARQWSLAHGVPAEAVLVEDSSRTTQENLAFALPLLRQHGLERVLLVSDPLHMRRSVAIARRLGIEALPSPTPTSRYVGWKSRLGFLAGESWYLARCRATGHC